ncbi:MAG: type II toxin-antitoxin system PemK/MazF family toxin [Candidatus Moeniiplasma glomeromycotorum]|nr:type II toxin-antitoxin system PemK/MazF family toxin [Candidatus Moeniiplasma glomeromycotorum]MCE8168482.1 type II toxin-antitoxin system PemK/MazF family toxin [Candidatus Moeniiplasma glomeromycotorum]MCE8169999.1 type II toxin-antitoxin system PemK/MazF family toxin [Candidatus Moeniiplasma glomeromycotorum]
MSKAKPKFPQRGQIWLVDFNRKNEKEINKIRPTLVVSNNIQNELDEQIIMAPLTSDEIKEVADYEVFIKNTKETGLDKPSKVLLQRVRAVEKELRLINYLGEVDKETMKEVEKALKTVLDLED